MAAALNVGFVGLGNIGKPMALRLASQAAERGFSLGVFDIAEAPLAELKEAGASVHGSVADLARDCDVVCVMVRDDDQVRDVLGEVMGVSGDRTTVVIHSTVATGTPAQLADVAARHGVRVLDAPVSGGAMGASDGRLAILVGGEDAAFEAARPVLEAMGEKVIHAGPIGAGTMFKLARNMMHFAAFTAATEAQRLAEAAGLDLAALGDVVRYTDAITGGPGAIMYRDTTAPIARDDFWFGVFEHVVSLGEKDLTFATELADDLGVEVPLAKLALARLADGLGMPSSKDEE
ncbi:NAD(P)-dependent oxidoreductase [Nocardioides acrostichi]|uniref:NAD(P)-dependent oxidoreductase n=1 Tax=Nocardioides acrostichi TaxID=2784339 RepID=A0A930Y6D4_9ACTN|nr:NAD(P)-dependent oxidoreductase [Nocardioides acrostichi]MBF4162230.1 NAD(P)-dependent oxidoreductase [Nocardioides acrostichi]